MVHPIRPNYFNWTLMVKIILKCRHQRKLMYRLIANLNLKPAHKSILNRNPSSKWIPTIAINSKWWKACTTHWMRRKPRSALVCLITQTMIFRRIAARMCSRIQRRTLIRSSINCRLGSVMSKTRTSMMKSRSMAAIPNKWVWMCTEIPMRQYEKRRPRWEICKMFSWNKVHRLRVVTAMLINR